MMNSLLLKILGNPIVRSDSYKVGHWTMYRPDQQTISSYFESRGYDASFNLPFMNSVQSGERYCF